MVKYICPRYPDSTGIKRLGRLRTSDLNLLFLDSSNSHPTMEKKALPQKPFMYVDFAPWSESERERAERAPERPSGWHRVGLTMRVLTSQPSRLTQKP